MRVKSLDSWFAEQHHLLVKKVKAGFISWQEYYRLNRELKERYRGLKEHGCRFAPE